MSEPFEMGKSRLRAPGDQYMDSILSGADAALDDVAQHPLDGEAARKEHRQLLEWFYLERQKQAENRLQMATDADFYDNEQWDAQDAADVRSRGQMPLNFNEIAPAVDWLIGTERRTRVDWNVLPRTEDDVQSADIKEKVLKFVSDLNRSSFARSRAFADAVKVGVGWVDDGARDDPTQDVLYSKYEDWRNVLWDSSSYDLDLSDARYLFRWRWVDADIAEMMFPERRAQIRRAVIDAGSNGSNAADDWYLGEQVSATSGTTFAGGAGVVSDARRNRIRLIECQYRKPVKVRMVADGAMRGAVVDERDHALLQHVATGGSELIDKIMMRVHVAVFTETDMLSMEHSAYRHNRFSLTPIWCYRRGKDRLPYGAIRRVRDVQQDLNKRASKALFLLNTNQVITEKGAVEDPNVAREEVDRPDGWIEVAANKRFDIRRDTDAATGQIQMMTLDAQKIQNSVGINNENLGRQSNAQSGEAIRARQLQGSVGTTEPFDNLRLAVQVQGEKLLSLAEQFYTEEKVIRLTGSRGGTEWVRANQPEVQPDGSVRYLNDITASSADFVVSEQDYAGTLRQVMLESITNMAQRLDPALAMRMFVIAMEFSDLPNKDDIVAEFRKVLGERDPSTPMTPDEMQQEEQMRQAQAQALQQQQELAALTLEEQRAKVAKLNAEAQRINNEVGGNAETQRIIQQIQSNAADEIDRLSERLRKAQADAANKTMAINREADVKLEQARIDADTKVRLAEIEASASGKIDALLSKLAHFGVPSTSEKGAPRADVEIERRLEEARSEAKAASRSAQEAQMLAAEVKGMAQAWRPPSGDKTITMTLGDGKHVSGKIKSDTE